MKKTLQIVCILFVVLIVVPLLAGAIGGAVLDAVAAVYLIALLVSPIVLIFTLIRRRKQRKARKTPPQEQEPAAQQTPPPPVQSVKVTKSAVVPRESDNLDIDEDDDIAYRYKNVGVFVLYTDVFNHPALVEGAIVTFRQEPENTYDHRAVAVVIGRKRIGYLFRGKLQDMANDWLERGDSVSGRVVRVDPDVYDAKNNAVKIDLYFYN